MNKFKERFLAVMQATTAHNPMGPIIVQEAYSSVERLGKLFALLASKEEAEAIAEKLMSQWTDEELETIGYKPEFVVALCSILVETLLGWARRLPPPQERVPQNPDGPQAG